jgi:predicted phage terminase large subunit-like protein
MLTPEQIDNLPPDTKKEYLKTALLLDQKKKDEAVRNDFLAFVKHMWPEFIEGEHHKIMAEKFNRVASGELKRLIINMAPRHTKSEFASNYLPAWMIGNNPSLKIIQATNNAELAVRFGRKAKSLIDTEEYQNVFGTRLREDSQAAGKWETAQGGEYYAAGVGGSITGRGADLLIIDDPHSEQDAMNPASYDRVYEWYTSGPRQRLQPGGRIIVVMTRWSVADLTGKLMKAQKEPKSDQWGSDRIPCIMPSGKPVWPGYWKLEELEAVMKKETADYSAITTWGVFQKNEDSAPMLMLIDMVKDRYEFPELRRVAQEQYDYWKPETVIVEAKASGLPLTYELRKLGIPVINFTPSKGNDKHTRVNSVAPLFESGMIWYPDRKFADEVIEECAAFPLGEHDDLVDSMTQAVMRFRQGGFVDHPDDYEDEPLPHQERTYY